MLKMPPAFQMPLVDLEAVSAELARTGKQVHVMWQEPETLAFVARGRAYRSEFHINPADEVIYMLHGEMRLHYRTSEGKEDVAVLKQGSIIYTPGGIPHSPRFPPDAFALIIERKRTPARSTASNGSAPLATSCSTKRRSSSPTTPSTPYRSPTNVRRFSDLRETAFCGWFRRTRERVSISWLVSQSTRAI